MKPNPCPFCGTASVDVYGSGISAFAYCHHCSAKGPLANSKSDATRKWNTRKTPAVAKGGTKR